MQAISSAQDLFFILYVWVSACMDDCIPGMCSVHEARKEHQIPWNRRLLSVMWVLGTEPLKWTELRSSGLEAQVLPPTDPS